MWETQGNNIHTYTQSQELWHFHSDLTQSSLFTKFVALESNTTLMFQSAHGDNGDGDSV
jgi:hypothetical protein